MINISDGLKDKLNNMPDLPGVYKMLDRSGRIIYIGKSKSLRNRTRSYFTGGHKWVKIERMITLIHDIEYEVADTHLEARLRECRLIKDLQPIFNSQFKNDRRYTYLKVEDYNIYNSLSVIYHREDGCYGPFRSMSVLIEAMDSLRNLYPITKENGIYNFQHHIMPIKMNIDVFNKNKIILNEIFSDDKNLQLFIGRLEEKMKEASSYYKFERALYYRNLITNLEYIKNTIFNYKEIFNRHIILKLIIPSGYKLFYVTKGEIINMEKYNDLKDEDLDNFIIKSNEIIPLKMDIVDEKESMDFINILYSEIKTLLEENIIYLK